MGRHGRHQEPVRQPDSPARSSGGSRGAFSLRGRSSAMCLLSSRIACCLASVLTALSRPAHLPTISHSAHSDVPWGPSTRGGSQPMPNVKGAVNQSRGGPSRRTAASSACKWLRGISAIKAVARLWGPRGSRVVRGGSHGGRQPEVFIATPGSCRSQPHTASSIPRDLFDLFSLLRRLVCPTNSASVPGQATTSSSLWPGRQCIVRVSERDSDGGE